jgi:hypothetical protein
MTQRRPLLPLVWLGEGRSKPSMELHTAELAVCLVLPPAESVFQPDGSLTRGFIVPKARTRQADGNILHPYSIGLGFLPR